MLQAKIDAKKQKQARVEQQRSNLRKQLEKEFKQRYHLIDRADIVHGTHKRGLRGFFAVAFLVLVAILAIIFWSVLAPNMASIIAGLIILVVLYVGKRSMRLTVVTKRWRMLLPTYNTINPSLTTNRRHSQRNTHINTYRNSW